MIKNPLSLFMKQEWQVAESTDRPRIIRVESFFRKQCILGPKYGCAYWGNIPNSGAAARSPGAPNPFKRMAGHAS